MFAYYIIVVFYPKWWLKAVGYFDAKPNPNPNAILFASEPQDPDVEEFVMQTVSLSSLIMSCFVCAVVFGMSGYHLAKRVTTERTADSPSNGGILGEDFVSGIASKYRAYSGTHRGYSSIECNEL